MSKLLKLRAEYKTVTEKAQSILDTAAKDGNRDLTEAEATEFKALAEQSEQLKAAIKTEEELEAAKSNVNANLKEVNTIQKRKVEDDVAVTSSRPRLLDDPKRGFRSLGEFGQNVAAAQTPGAPRADERLLVIQASATGMQQASGPDGGYAVPPAYSTNIWDGMNQETDNLLAMVDQYTVEGESLTFPANAETSRVNGSRYGAMQGYWLAEADQIGNSRPKLRKVSLQPQQLAVLVYATEKLLRNSPVALDQYLTRAAISEINFLVGNSIIRGTGAGQPKGILNSGCLVTVAKETSQAAATFQQANVSKMWGRMHPKARKNAVWFVNVDVEPQLDGFNTPVKNVAGNENVGGIGNNVYNAEKHTLKGRPIIPIEFCETLGTVGDVILADMKAYAAGVQGAIDAAMSMHLRFDYAEMAFRFMFSVDGQTWLASAITPFKGSNTLSPFVVLATRS